VLLQVSSHEKNPSELDPTIRETTQSALDIRDSSVGIAAGYGLEDGGVGVQVLVRQEFSLLHVVHTSFGVHPTSYTMGIGGSLLGGKAAVV
jgi:hypothetical protein